MDRSNYQYEDDSANKRRKRGSIFFRKKKDKDKEKQKKSSHHFVAVCYSNSATCDVCSKPMTNKPALRCESCQVCVHEHSCKDQISDCSKLKNPKVIQKPGGNVGLSSTTKSASLGSYVVGGTGGQSGTTSKNQQAAVARSRSAAAHSSSPTRPTTASSPRADQPPDMSVSRLSVVLSELKFLAEYDKSVTSPGPMTVISSLRVTRPEGNLNPPGPARPNSGCVSWPPRPANTPARPNSGCVSSPVRRLSGFSQWKRVATKLGVK
ncbi:hypothetical protein Pmani_011187 [Petrolisthes manimaculis]|uniref:Phorbol-ester/DAG-type domain-containing protein n=1 Tax=Petrolisthes manimaculis TaxID=1843537 RepID=A0AAE1Q1L6_9EUCA|nr:hypothetical protein Pmani_011187 [Petrolisthes manimaculis]